jgi:hypothetical protein
MGPITITFNRVVITKSIRMMLNSDDFMEYVACSAQALPIVSGAACAHMNIYTIKRVVSNFILMFCAIS